MEVDAGQDMKRWVKVHHCFQDISNILFGLNQANKCKRMPPFETSIHLHILPCAYPTSCVIQTSFVSWLHSPGSPSEAAV